MGKKYDYTTSASFAWTGVARTITYYDGTSYTGERCTEKTCPINNLASCMNAFQFLCIKTSNDKSTLDGILGLGRKGTSYNGQHYVD